MPNGVAPSATNQRDIDALADGSFPQKGLIHNAPRETSREQLHELYARALQHW